MSIKIGNFAKETTTTTGNGTYTLAGALSTKFQTLVAAIKEATGISTGPWDNVPYHVTDGVDHEIGLGTLVDGASDTLTRDTILESTNGGSAVSWGAGSKDVILGVPANTLYELIEGYAHGQCRLILDGSNVRLNPWNGNKIKIDGKVEIVPDAGVPLSAAGLTIDTDHNLYAFMSSGVMTLQAITTGHAISTQIGNKGVEIKSGANTHTLVGRARPVSGPVWVDADDQRFVISWFNRRGIGGTARFTTTRSTSSSTYSELNTEIRNEFLTWADEIVIISAQGSFSLATGNEGISTSIGIDDAIAEDIFVVGGFDTTGNDNQEAQYGMTMFKSGLSEGYHYATLLGKNSAGTNVANWNGGTSSLGNTIKTMIRG